MRTNKFLIDGLIGVHLSSIVYRGYQDNFKHIYFFLTKRFPVHKNTSHLEVYARVKRCCFCCLVLAYFCFVSWFSLVTCFCAREIFSLKKKKKKKKGLKSWNGLDNLNIQYTKSESFESKILNFTSYKKL